MTLLRTTAIALLAAGTAHAGEYAPEPAKSTLTFRGQYDGEPFEGRFARFDARITHDAANPAHTAIEATIELDSADTGLVERDETLRGDEFFATARWPNARFVATACRTAAPRVSCDAELTIRDRTVRVPFDFTWTPLEGGRALLAAKVVLRRLAFDVGTGDWADPALLADEVEVEVALELVPR